MEKISNILPQQNLARHGTNQLYDLAKRVADATGDARIGMWLRTLQTKQFEAERALLDLREIGQTTRIRNRGGMFMFLFKKYQKDLTGSK